MIRTKLAPPRTPRNVVHRPGILESLDLGCDRVLTVVQAPAGFGKSTVLTEWRNRLIERGRIVAWVTLDEDDNDPAQFAAYVTGALAEALGPLADHAPEFTAESETAPPKVRLTSVINALDPIDARITLVLDDYERIHSSSVQDLLSFLLLRAPANLNVVIATRSEPALPLAYLRAHDELVEVGPDKLRFDLEDTQRFFAVASTLKLDPAEARTLYDATEGWVTGLQIASIALRGQTDAGPLIAGFSGKFKAINAYLAESVLPNLDPAVVEVLLRTSILERFNGPLCEAVAGVPAGEGAARLLQLHQQNLFLQALDDENRWFRYHALFRDFLRGELERRLPHRIRDLHTGAARWFADAGFWAEAVRHALAAERLDLATEWVERCAMREVEASRVHELLAWVRKLPEESVRTRHRLRMAMAWALMLTQQLDEALAIVEDLAAQTRGVPSATALETELLALRFCIIALKDQTAAALPLGERCLERLETVRADDEHSALVIQAFLNGLTHCYQKAGRVEDARAMLSPERYPLLPDTSRNLVTQAYRAIVLSACDLREAKLHQGARELREALRLAELHAGTRSAAATMIACSLAAVHYEWDDLDKADELLADRLDIVDETCYLDSVRMAYLTRARVAAVRGDEDGAHSILDRAEHIALRRGWTRLGAVVLAERMRLWLQAGRPREAEAALQRLEQSTSAVAPSVPSAASETWRVRCLAQARWLLHQNRHADAATLLHAVLADEDPTRSPYPCARVRVMLAVALSQARDLEPARAQVRALLEIGEMSGMVRSIADEGAAIASLIVRELGTSDAGKAVTDWRAALRAALGKSVGTGSVSAPAGTVPAGRAAPGGPRETLVEPLSARERDILSLIARGMSNEQAARALRLGTETVKWHLKNVYSKLGVSRRTLAVHRARKLDLLGDRDD